jgi:protocatechuate 3,4-dioxygenase beta subunit
MDYDDQMVGRILSRRDALLAAARVGAGLAIGGAMSRYAFAEGPATQPQLHLVASPVLTEGPFFVDEKLNRSDLIGDTKRPSVVNGLPLLVAFTIYKLSGKDYAPLKNAHVDVWHADTAGVYSDESNPMNHENTARQTWLRGYQVTDANGQAQFKTIVPGWYDNRTAHIHFKVRQFTDDGKTIAEFTSQLFFRDEDADRIFAKPPYNARGERGMRNRDDMVYNDGRIDGKPAGEFMLLDLKPSADGTGLASTFGIALTDANTRGGREGRRPGGPSGPGGPSQVWPGAPPPPRY